MTAWTSQRTYAWTFFTGMVVALTILAAIVVMAYLSAEELVVSAERTVRTQALLSALDQVIVDILDVETAARGYVLTGDPRYLEPYEVASRELAPHLQAVRGLLSVDGVEQEHLDALDALAAQKLAIATETIAVRRGGDTAAATARIASGTGKVVMDDIRRITARLRDAEQTVLFDRDRSVREDAQWAKRVIFSGTILAVLLIAMSAVVAFRSATARRRVSEALVRAHDELEERVRDRTAELAQANQQLRAALDEIQQTQNTLVRQERLRALGELASGIAHDFNNSLATIIGYTELLLADPDSLQDRTALTDRLHLIHSAAEDAASVVGRLREFYRQREKGEGVRPVHVNDLIAQVISLTQPRWRDQAQADGRTIDVRADLGDVPAVAGQESELREALTNLVLNSIDAMPSGGTLVLRTRVAGEQVLVDVADSGVGMPADVRDRIFEPFFTTKGEQGTGLGLAIVHGIIQRHGGDISVASTPGAGTTFTLRLPTSREAVPQSQASAPDARLRGLRVLVVDDEAALRRILTSYLQVDGHVVHVAANGREAVDLLRTHHVDLVITDRAMPDMGGDQLAAVLEQLAPDVSVIMLTGLGDLMNDAEERPVGVDLVIAKPITMSGLRRAVWAVVGRSAP